MFPIQKKSEFRDRFPASRVAVLIDERDIDRRPDGRLLLNGFFGVRHPKGQRPIFDSRPANAGKVRPPWGHLSTGFMLTGLRVSLQEVIRGSGDDLEVYFIR